MRPTIPGEMALSANERAEVERHVGMLAKAVTPGPDSRIAGAIAGMLTAFPAQAISDGVADARAAMYRAALCDLPAWSVEKGVQHWMRREHPEARDNYAFPPSPPQLRRLALIACSPMLAELHKLKRLLDAKPERVITPEERARNFDRLKAIVTPPSAA